VHERTGRIVELTKKPIFPLSRKNRLHDSTICKICPNVSSF
jgi:hypothetical protein